MSCILVMRKWKNFKHKTNFVMREWKNFKHKTMEIKKVTHGVLIRNVKQIFKNETYEKKLING